MKKTVFILFLTTLFALFNNSGYGQGFPYHLYQTRTMAELVDLNASKSKKITVEAKQMMISDNPFYSAVRLEYAGKSRSLSKEKLDLFKIWQETFEVDSRLLGMLDKEFLFKQCAKEYWIPVQKPAADDFPKDFKAGDKITLYLMMVGGLEDKGNREYVFFTNSFRMY